MFDMKVTGLTQRAVSSALPRNSSNQIGSGAKNKIAHA